MDSTATSLSMDNKIPVLLFALKDPQNIIRAVMGCLLYTSIPGGIQRKAGETGALRIRRE